MKILVFRPAAPALSSKKCLGSSWLDPAYLTLNLISDPQCSSPHCGDTGLTNLILRSGFSSLCYPIRLRRNADSPPAGSLGLFSFDNYIIQLAQATEHIYLQHAKYGAEPRNREA